MSTMFVGRLCLVAIAALMVSCGPRPLAGELVVAPNVSTATGDVRLFQAPDPSSRVIATLAPGSRIVATATFGPWVLVQSARNPSVQGFIRETDTTPAPQPLSSLEQLTSIAAVALAFLLGLVAALLVRALPKERAEVIRSGG